MQSCLFSGVDLKTSVYYGPQKKPQRQAAAVNVGVGGQYAHCMLSIQWRALHLDS